MKNERIIISLFLIISLSITQCSSSSVDAARPVHDQNSLKLELIHRHSPQLLDDERPKTQLERIKELLHNDIKRQKMISHTRHLNTRSRRRQTLEETTTSSSNRRANNDDIEMPIYSGSDYGTGQYFVEFKVGTPAKKFTLIVDSGTDLTWLSCRYNCGPGGANCTNNGNRNRRRVFQPHLSSSFRPIPCFSQMCKVDLMDLFSLAACPTPITPCAYDFRYLDGSSSLGIFANETVTLSLTNGRKVKLDNMLIGCSDSFQGPNFLKAEGVLGLAYSNYSFTTRASEKFGGKFSYCLVDHLSHKYTSNYLLFGDNLQEKSSLSEYKRFTKLELGLIKPFYAVNVRGISIGGVMLDIPLEVWDANRGGGTVIDSGTSLTFLTDPAYRLVMEVLEKFVSKFERVASDVTEIEYCFNSSRGFDKSSVPKLMLHFADGARFQPHSKSYIIDAADEIKCLGFSSVAWPGTTVIGNILQQNYLWEFDTIKSKLAFAPSTCT